MRIHYLSPSLIPSRRANSVHVMKMAEALAGLGHDVTLFASPGDEPDTDPWSWYAVSSIFRLALCPRPKPRNFGRLVYSIAVAHRSRALGGADLYIARSAPALALLALGKTPFIYEMHMLSAGRIGRALESWLTKRSNCLGIVAISGALKQDFLAQNPHYREESVLVAHDAATPPNDATAAHHAQARICIGYAGHLYPGKGMEIISRIAPHMPDVDFLVAGGTQNDMAHWRKLCPSNVHFLGHQDQSKLSGIYRRMDIALAPAQPRIQTYDPKADIARWTSPLKLFEYMAHGLPIVASDLPVFHEVLKAEETALFVPPTNVSAWVDTLRMLIKDAVLREKLGNSARTHFNARHTWDMRAREILDYFLPSSGGRLT